MATKIETPYPIFEDVDGQPLEDGYLYIGTAGLDPALNAITVYSDASLSTTVTQPVRTTAGFPVVSGSPIRLYTAATDFSLRVSNKNNTQISQDLNAGANQREFSNVVEDSSGNVGIGTSSPNVNLQVAGTTDGAIQLTNSTSGATGSDGCFLTLQATTNDMLIQNLENSNTRFFTNGSERMRILPTGGLTFNGDTAAANALDDYEEGTFTPALQNIGTGTYTSQDGEYTKVGNVVNASFSINIATVGTASGDIVVTGLPFTVAALSVSYLSSSIYASNFSVARSDLTAACDPGSTTVAVRYGSGTATISALQHSDIGTGNIIFSITYKV